MTPVKKQAPSPSSLKSQGETKVKSPATVILPPPTREKTSPSGILDQKAPASNAPRYRALERIGEGAMGEIWKAEDMTIGRTVAIKRRKPKLTREALNLFVEEARRERPHPLAWKLRFACPFVTQRTDPAKGTSVLPLGAIKRDRG